jgi:DNA processing protein
LAEEILEKGGCWVSEYPPGTRAQRSYFVERDRLQAGMSGGVIVVETDTDGGTMHTVRFAQTQSRPIACLAHPPEFVGSEKTRGNQLLLREGRATPLSTAEDLCAFIKTVRDHAGRWTAQGMNGRQDAVADSATPPVRNLFSGDDGDGGGPL